MNNQEVQRILRAWDECCEQKTEFMSEISTLADGWEERVELCCEQWNSNLDDIIDLLEDWAAEYSATWTDFECQEEDNEVIDYELVYSNYLCQQEDDSVATTTSTSTSTTTINPFQIDFEILYDDYLCMMIDDPNVSTTTTIEKSGQISSYSATWEDYLCEMENNPSITTTTTTFIGTTTTSTTVDPEDVTFLATWFNFLCKMDDNPLLTTTTSTTTINEDDVDFDVIYSDYLCMMEDDGVTTTTTSTPASTTTTTTSTTTINEDDVDFDVIYSDYLCMMEDDELTTTTTTTTVPVTTTTTTSGSITYINGASFTGFGSNTEHSYIAQNITYINPGTIDKVTVNLDRIGAVNGVVTAYLYDGHIGSTDTSPAGGAALVGTSTNSINFSDLGIGGSSDFLFSSESVGVDYSIVLGFSGVSGWDGSNYVRLWRTEAQIVNGFFINVGGGAYNYEGTGSLHAQIRYTSTVPVTTTTTTI